MKALARQSDSSWIHSSTMDLIVGCCAWSLPLLLLGQAVTSSRFWIVLFYGLALVFNYPHYMATIYRAYHTREDFARYRIFTVHITAVLAAALLVAHFSPRLVPWLFTIYITWSPWHYMGQNFGLAMMFIRRNGLKIDRKDRDALWTSFVTSYMMIFLTFHTNPSTDPNFISLQLPTLLDTLRIPFMMVFLIVGIYPLGKLVRKTGWKPMLPAIALYITEFLWFVAPTILEMTSSIRLGAASYSAGVLALMHSAQYLWITSYYSKKESVTTGAWSCTRYIGIAVAGGIALFIPGPWLASRIFHVDFTATVLAFSAIVNIHHFILDGAVWKLREKRVASLLLSDVRPAVISAPWISSKRTGSKPVWSAAIVSLVALAGMDQVHHFFASRNDVAGLTVAATLIPYDSVVQSRLGRALIDQQRYDDAYEHYRKIVEQMHPDMASLVNFGLLCNRRGDAARAIESFDRALMLNPHSAPVHLHLAKALQANGKLEEAAEHFERYRQLLASAPDQIFVSLDH